MSTYTVTTLADGFGPGTLRSVLRGADATPAADTIVFAPGLEGGTLTLTQGQLALRSDVTIDGDRNNDGTGVTISGGGNSRVAAVSGAGSEVLLADLTITGGYSRGPGGAVRVGSGSALGLDGAELSGNRSLEGAQGYGRGGAVYADPGSSIVADRTTFSGNVADQRGGAIALADDTELVLTRSLLQDNRADSDFPGLGGAVFASGGSVTVTGSTVAGNVADYGGGLALGTARALVEDSTIVDNLATGADDGGIGGGIFTAGELVVRNSTVTGNGLGGFDSIRGAGIAAGGGLVLANSIVAGNLQGYVPELAGDITGTITSNGHNLIGSFGYTPVTGAVAGDIVGVAPGAVFAAIDPDTGGGVLARNGGPVPSVALRDVGSNPALSGAEPVAGGFLDGRGAPIPAPAGTNPDIGAFELAQGTVSRTPSGRNDALAGTAAADTLDGLGGADLVLGRAGNDALKGGIGSDTLRGGGGSDALDGDTGRDTASYRDAPGPVTASLAAGTAAGGAGSDTLREIENLEGSGHADGLTGDAGSNWLGGLAGNDRLFALAGDDVLLGGGGIDRLSGGIGRDLLEGGAGDDAFAFGRVAESPFAAGDLVTDFARGADRVDLAAIDAREAIPGNQPFAFLAPREAPFTAAGQVRWFQQDGDTLVEASIDADRAAEFQVRLAGLIDLSAADFVL